MSERNLQPEERAAETPSTPELIGAEGTEPMGEARRDGCPRERDTDEELDAALACTFPASDPVGCLTTCRTQRGG
jgi:hypothetical protein